MCSGVVPQHPLPTYPNGFPPDVIERLEEATGLRFCCNRPYSGTEVIEDFGQHHLDTGEVIEFTSARIEAIQAEIAERLGYEIVHHRLELYGRRVKAD